MGTTAIRCFRNYFQSRCSAASSFGRTTAVASTLRFQLVVWHLLITVGSSVASFRWARYTSKQGLPLSPFGRREFSTYTVLVLHFLYSIVSFKYINGGTFASFCTLLDCPHICTPLSCRLLVHIFLSFSLSGSLFLDSFHHSILPNTENGCLRSNFHQGWSQKSPWIVIYLKQCTRANVF